jgi:hypothetical protein
VQQSLKTRRESFTLTKGGASIPRADAEADQLAADRSTVVSALAAASGADAQLEVAAVPQLLAALSQTAQGSKPHAETASSSSTSACAQDAE